MSADAILTLRSEALDLAARAEQFSADVLGQQFARADNHRVVLMAQAVRMLRTFEAVRILVQADLNDAAGCVLRCLLEQYFVFRAIHRDPEFLQRATAEVEAESHKALKGLLRMAPSERAEDLTDKILTETLEQLRQGAGFNAFEWAARTGLQGAYLTLYRLLSVYAHGSLAVMEKYVVLNGAGHAERVQSRIASIESIEFLVCSTAMLLESVEAFDRQPYTEARRATLGFLSSEQRRLYQLYWDLRARLAPP